MRQSTFFQRFGLTICIVAIVCLPVLLYGAKLAVDSQTNDVSEWLPDDFPETETIHWFATHFGTDAIMVVSWPGCTLDDERLDQMREGLTNSEFTADDGTSERFFHNVFSGRDTLKQLTAAPVSLTREAAIERMRGWLVGSDQQGNPATCVVAFLTDLGWFNRHAAVERTEDIAHSFGVSSKELRLGGPAVDSLVIDAVSEKWHAPLGAASVLTGLIIAWFCLRKLRYVCALFFYAMIAWSASLSMVGFSGSNLDAVLVTMPALIYVLAVSAAVHMTGYYRDADSEVGAAQAPYRAFRLGWAPCTAAAVTTAFGVGSLMISKVVPVGRFGTYAAIGVLIALVLLFVVWPSSMQSLTRNRWRRTGGDADDPESETTVAANTDSQRSMWWVPLFRVATNHWLVIVLLLVVIIPVLGYGVSRIRTSINLSDLFSARSKIIRDYGWLESNVGPLVPVEVVLQFPKSESENPNDASEGGQTSSARQSEYAKRFRQRAHLVERTRDRINQMPDIGGALAGTTFAPMPIPKVPTGRSIRSTAKRGVIVKQIMEYRQKLVDFRYLTFFLHCWLSG